MQNETVVHFVNINKAVESALKTLGLRSLASDICFIRSIVDVQSIINFINSHPFVIEDNEEEGFILEKAALLIVDSIHKTTFTVIFPPEFYFHELLEPEAIRIVCKKLKYHELRAKKHIVQQLSWNVMNIFYTKDNVDSWDYAANIVIKMYRNGNWTNHRSCPQELIFKPALEDLIYNNNI